MSKIKRRRKSKEIASRREKEAFEAAAKYRNKIPRGGWAALKAELAPEFDASTRDFSRKLHPRHPVAKVGAKKSAGGSDQPAAIRDTAPAVLRAATISDRLCDAHMHEAAGALANAARTERSDLFYRRVMGLIRSDQGSDRARSTRKQSG